MNDTDAGQSAVQDHQCGADEYFAARREEDDISLCSIRVDEAVFGIETTKVREVLGRTDRGSSGGLAAGLVRHDVRRVPLAPAYVAGIIAYRGEVLTTLSLRVLLGGEPRVEGGCVMVLDDVETGERLGLMVDAVNSVVKVRREMLEPNPCTLDARSRALFDGVYKMGAGMIVRIDPSRLSAAKLAASGAFEEQMIRGGSRCVC